MALFQQSVLKKYLHDLTTENLQAAWALFQAHFHHAAIQQNILNAKEEEYQEGFVRDLFVNVLGYTLKPQPGFNLVMEQKSTSDATKSDGAILAPAGNVVAVIELKDTNTTDLDKVAKQAFGYKHQHKDCIYVVTANFEKLRLYISDAIDFEEFDLFTLSKERFAVLYCCLRQESLHNDVPLQMKQQSLAAEENITKKLYADYSRFKKALFASITQKNPQYNQLELFKKTQKLLDRFLFILFAEDRLLVPPNSVRDILQQWEQLQELDNYVPLYDRFKKYFGYLNTGYQGKQYEIFAYNGGLFAPDDILDNIIIEDQLLYDSCKGLSNYDFESEVDVNILGHIFEHSLNEIEAVERELSALITIKDSLSLEANSSLASIDSETVSSITSPLGFPSGRNEVRGGASTSKRKKDGVFYTPRYITKYIVENTLGTLCTQQKETLQINADEFAPQKRKANAKQLLQKLDDYRQWLLQLTICDPACGSGAFLNQALEFLIAEHKSIDELKGKLFGDAMVLSDMEASILENNLYGVDINDEATEIAKLSLWLRTARKGRKLNNLNQHIKCGNSLIDDPAVAGDKAFNWEKEFPQVFAKGGFDVVIGNPPYVVYIKSIVGENTISYVNAHYTFAEYNPNTYALFCDLSINMLIKTNGYLGFIIPNTWLNNKYFSRMRTAVYSKRVNEIVYLKDTVFDEVVETVILLIKNKKEENPYFVKLLTDIKKQNVLDSKKVENLVMTIGINPFITENNLLIKNIEFSTSNLKEHAIVYRGLETRDNSKWLSTEKKEETFKEILLGKDVNRYSTSYSGTYVNFVKKEMKSNANESMFHRDKILMRRTGVSIIADIDSTKLLALKNLYLIIPKKEDSIFTILAQLNSKFLKYFHFEKSSGENKAFAQFKGEYVENFPCIIDQTKEILFKEKILSLKDKVSEYKTYVERLLQLLNLKYNAIIITNKLQDWPSLSFKDYLKELDKQKIKLSLPEQAEWMQYFEAEKRKANEIQQLISNTDKEIDEMVYNLYGLTEEERRIVEGS